MTASDPAATPTYPRDRRGYQTGPDLITALGVIGAGIALPMPVAQTSFMLGRAGTCDLRVDRKYLARMHARIERIADSLRGSIRVTNVSNGKNDIVYNGDVAESAFSMAAGEWFEIGESKYYALNDEMQIVRSRVMEALGIRQYGAIDEFLIAAVKDSARHIVLLGEPGSDQERLGRAIHQVSYRRHNQFQPLPERPKLDSATRQDLSDACNGTVLVHLNHKGKLDERLVAALVARDANLRLIICARSLDKVEASFPATVVNDAKKITIPPLRKRADEIPELLDYWFIERASPLRFDVLHKELREGLRNHTWPQNIKELRETKDLLIQLAPYRSVRQATKDSPYSRGALRAWAEKLNIKLQLPLVPDKTN